MKGDEEREKERRREGEEKRLRRGFKDELGHKEVVRGGTRQGKINIDRQTHTQRDRDRQITRK